MIIPRQTSGIVRATVFVTSVGRSVGITPGSCDCDFDCRPWDVVCKVREAACRVTWDSCSHKCTAEYLAAHAACYSAGAGAPVCFAAAALAYKVCKDGY